MKIPFTLAFFAHVSKAMCAMLALTLFLASPGLAGQRGINSNVSIDGADYNQPFFGGIRGGERSNNAFTVPQEAIQEFQVIASGYSAEFGRSTGGIVNAITKSGTNSPQGSLFYVNRNKDWAERNAFGQTAAPTQQQWGGSIGGPIAQNRLFYFVAGEMQRLKNTRNVVFSLTGITPNADNAEAYNFFKGLEELFDATNDAEAILGRVDYQMPEGNRLAVRYFFSNNKALNSNATGNALSDTTISALSNNGTERDRTNTVVGEFTSPLRSNTLLEIRGQYSREERPRDANALLPLITGTVGNVGTVSFLGENIQQDWRAQLAANTTWVRRTTRRSSGSNTTTWTRRSNSALISSAPSRSSGLLRRFWRFSRWAARRPTVRLSPFGCSVPAPDR